MRGSPQGVFVMNGNIRVDLELPERAYIQVKIYLSLFLFVGPIKGISGLKAS
jgi:hypothetical protein